MNTENENVKETLANYYREFLNNYLTAEKFAEHMEITVKEANTLIQLGKRYHEDEANEYDELRFLRWYFVYTTNKFGPKIRAMKLREITADYQAEMGRFPPARYKE